MSPFHDICHMVIEKRREQRVPSDLQVKVRLRDGSGGETLAGPAPARLHDISSYGASLIIPQIRFGPHHLFYSSRDHHPSQILYIEIELSETDQEPFALPVRPVGFDRVLMDQTMPFQMGVEFMPEADGEKVNQLIRLVHEKKKTKKHWWEGLVDKLWPEKEDEEA